MLDRVTRYTREVWAEARKIVWLSRRQTLIYSLVVVVAVAVLAGCMYAFDELVNLISHGIITAA